MGFGGHKGFWWGDVGENNLGRSYSYLTRGSDERQYCARYKISHPAMIRQRVLLQSLSGRFCASVCFKKFLWQSNAARR